MRINLVIQIIFLLIFILSTGFSQPGESDKTIDLQVSEKVDSIIRALKIPDIRLELSFENKKNKDIIDEYRNKFIIRAEEIISQNKVPNNFEFQAYFYGILGAYYIPKDILKSFIYMNKALETTELITDNRILYQAQIETYLLTAFLMAEKFKDALQLSEKFIEKYPGLGSGALKNAVATYGVNSYAESSKKSGVTYEKMKKYLNTLSEKYSNEIACAADFQLLLLAQEQKNNTRVETLKNRILTRYPKTWEYTIIYESYFDTVLK
ncbi:MAG: hypothetical protein QME58_03590 [Bacteroidota bacterium]|nr:hypothetical protein [Bacteroidota bacterium]